MPFYLSKYSSKAHTALFENLTRFFETRTFEVKSHIVYWYVDATNTQFLVSKLWKVLGFELQTLIEVICVKLTHLSTGKGKSLYNI